MSRPIEMVEKCFQIEKVASFFRLQDQSILFRKFVIDTISTVDKDAGGLISIRILGLEYFSRTNDECYPFYKLKAPILISDACDLLFNARSIYICGLLYRDHWDLGG